MSDGAKLIDPSGIPHFIGDLATLDTDVMLLTADAGQFRASGSDVHTEFQGLSAFYEAPEAEQLFATTLPVRQKSDAFADDLEKVTAALSDYSLEVQPLAEKLNALKADATTFVNSVTGDDDWRKDQDKVDHNNDLWHDVNHTVAAFQAAERTAYNKVMALIGGTNLTADDGSHGKNMYGYSADDLDHAGQTPWGTAVEREYEGWAWLAHQSKQVWDGIWQDGVIGTVHGLGTLFGSDGWDAAGEAWENLAKLGVASTLTTATMGAWWLTPDDRLPSWLRDSRTVYKQTVKGFVAYDQWKTNPARAAGAFGFNVLTVVGTEGVGSAASGAGKAGTAARALSVAGKVGRAIDPMTYIGKAGKFAFAKVGDTFTTLKNLHTGTYTDLANLGDRYTEHPTPLAERPSSIPDNAVAYLDAKGNPVYLTSDGHVLNADGSVRQHVTDAKVEVSATDREVLDSTPHSSVPGVREPEPAGIGARSEHAGTAAEAGSRSVGHSSSGSAAGDANVGETSPTRSAPTESVKHPPPGSGSSGTSAELGHGEGPPRPAHGSTGSGTSHGGKPGPPAHEETGHHADEGHETGGDNSPAGTAGHESGEDTSRSSAASEGADPHAGHQEDLTRPALLPADGPLTLDAVRKAHDPRARWTNGEEFHRQMYGGGAERHYPVATNQDPKYPVTAKGGRKVDVPVDMPDGRTLAVEVKTYREYRTITLHDGSKKAVKGEVPLSKHIKEQIHKDIALRLKDPRYDPRWSFTHAGPSKELRDYLVEARIIFLEYGPTPKK
ncbi:MULTISPECIES: hypothetical protein [unclassified Streptomyces]|uniref:hypothetical protein n=1 Tax=unclassified Streptomyces TaxID=2593676 RepID=UPI0037F76B7D